MIIREYHPAASRGGKDHGWLLTRHTFSFADYYDPQRMGFGVLRVLNDDQVAPAKGFGEHHHDNMEIISIPLEGIISHEDSMGNRRDLRTGEVQVMSAGTGVSHSEFNASPDQILRFLQIWIETREHNIAPHYDQRFFDVSDRKNKLQLLVSPVGKGGLEIAQDAWISRVELDEGNSIQYEMHNPEKNGVYVFVISGSVQIENQILAERDGAGIIQAASIDIQSLKEGSDLLFIEVPLQ